jgi:hypothetical protein
VNGNLVAVALKPGGQAAQADGRHDIGQARHVFPAGHPIDAERVNQQNFLF